MDITSASAGPQAQEPSIDRDTAQNFLRSALAYADDESGLAILFGAGESSAPQTLRVASSFPDDDVSKALAWNSATEQRNLYWGAATMSLDLPPQSRGKENDIVAVHAIIVDLDDPTAAARYERSDYPLGLVPTYVIRTSSIPHNRYQLVYRLDEPCSDLTEWRQAAQRLQYAWGADNCTSDPTHVWRVPGTINWPNAKKRADGRVPEASILVEASPEQEFALGDFEDLPEPPDPPAAGPVNVLPFIRQSPSEYWATLGPILTHLPSWMQIAMLEEHELPKAANGQPIDRSGFEWQIACEAAKAGLTEGDYAAMFQLGDEHAFADKWRERERQRPGLGDEWARKTYQKAAADIMARGERIPPPPVERGEGQQASTVVFGVGQTGNAVEPLPLLWLDEVEPVLDVADFVEGILTDGAFSVVYGDSNAGKTFFVSDLAMRIAMGWGWQERQVDPGAVLYVACEGGNGIKNRIAAFKRHHNIAGPVPFAVVPASINLRDASGDAERVIATARLVEEKTGRKVRFIVIDTLSRALAGGDENGSVDMGELVKRVDQIRQQTGAHVLLIHHTGKDQARGARGHSLLRAATDTEIEVFKAEGTETATATVKKQRDLATAGIFHFNLHSVPLGTDRRGNSVTSCVAEQANAPQKKKGSSGSLSPNTRKAYEILIRAVEEKGEIPPASVRDHAPDKAVPIETWREYCRRFRISDAETNDAQGKAFRRASEDLQNKHKLIGYGDGYVWLIN